jgi:hypothetical protein
MSASLPKCFARKAFEAREQANINKHLCAHAPEKYRNCTNQTTHTCKIACKRQAVTFRLLDSILTRRKQAYGHGIVTQGLDLRIETE